jgi:hypothetical protein
MLGSLPLQEVNIAALIWKGRNMTSYIDVSCCEQGPYAVLTEQ